MYNGGLFGERFPYTDFHAMNQDWIISIVSEFARKYPSFETELKMKLNMPSDSGSIGDILTNLGNGKTAWTSFQEYSVPTIIQAVYDWLDEHPEATTTVQDGAITYNKLDSVLKSVVYNPDTESGTDYQKLQASINKAITNEYSTIMLTRLYDITGFSLLINKGLYDASTHVRKKLTFIALNNGGIQKQDAGFMFTGDRKSVV